MTTRRRVLAVLAAVAMLAMTVAGGVALAQDASPDNGEEYTLDELKQDGEHYSVDSARIVPSQSRVYWLEHRAVNRPWTSVSKESPGVKLGEDTTLKTNTVYLRTILATGQPQQANVTIVYWDQATREVQRGNATTTETYAANQSVVHKTVTLEPGWSLAEIDLPQHSETTRVTMWLDSHPETARWTFTHRSVATQQTIPISSWKGFLVYAVGLVVLPGLFVSYIGNRKVKTWIEKAGAPPGHGFAYYAIVITLLAGIAMYASYYAVAEIVVTAPPVLGVYSGLIVTGFALATHEGRAERKMFLQPYIQEATAFTKSKIPSVGSGNADDALSFSEDMPIAQWDTFKVLDEGANGLSIVRKGKLAFLARLKGGRARIKNVDELKTRTSTPNSPADEIFFVDPDADTLIDYEPPGLRLKLPEIETWHDLVWPVTLLGGGGMVAWQLTQTYGPTAWAVLLAAVPILVWKFAVEGTDTYCEVEPAPVALRSVLATMIAANIGARDAQKLEDAEEFAWKAVAGNEAEERDRRERKERTVTEHINKQRVGGDDADAAEEEEDEETVKLSDVLDIDEVAGDD